MFFRMLYDDRLAQATYFIGCQKTGDAIVIDPQRDVERYLALARREGMKITAIAETHIHADFLSGARELAERSEACLYLSSEGGDDWQYQWLDKKQGGGSYRHLLVKDGDTFDVGNIRLQVMHTPGHTPEHICFLVIDLGGGADQPMGIATGDFVFVGDVGRPDLLETAAGETGQKEPSARALYHSIQRFKTLPEYLQVWPAHGSGSACGKALGAVPQSTVGYERRFNAAIKTATAEEEFVRAVLYGQPEPPMYFARMKRENRDGPVILGQIPQPKAITAKELQQMPEQSVVIDTRNWKNFCAGHLPRSLHAPLTNSFPTVAGSYVLPGQPIYLIGDEKNVAEAVTYLIRIGIDSIVGYATPETLTNYPGKLATIRSMPICQFEPSTQDALILDVRNPAEYDTGHFDGALNIAHTRLLPRLQEIPRDKPVFVHCLSGIRAAAAAAMMQSHGYQVVHIFGSYADWKKR